MKIAADKAADADGRSLSALIEKLLTDHCREAGFLPPVPRDHPKPD